MKVHSTATSSCFKGWERQPASHGCFSSAAPRFLRWRRRRSRQARWIQAVAKASPSARRRRMLRRSRRRDRIPSGSEDVASRPRQTSRIGGEALPPREVLRPEPREARGCGKDKKEAAGASRTWGPAPSRRSRRSRRDLPCGKTRRAPGQAAEVLRILARDEFGTRCSVRRERVQPARTRRPGSGGELAPWRASATSCRPGGRRTVRPVPATS